MEVRRTVPVKLNVDSDDATLLHETVDEFLWAANHVVDHAWQGEYKTTSKAQLQEETYGEVRDQNGCTQTSFRTPAVNCLGVKPRGFPFP